MSVSVCVRVRVCAGHSQAVLLGLKPLCVCVCVCVLAIAKLYYYY